MLFQDRVGLVPERFVERFVVLYDIMPHSEGSPNFAHWSWEPSIVIGVALLVGAYLYASRQVRRRHPGDDPHARWRASLFLLGSVILLLSLVSPLDELSDEYLFSAHMVQHILLATVVPPLLLLGTPDRLLYPVVRMRMVATIARFLTFPLTAFLIFNLDFVLWHLPVFYQAALADERIHVVQHLSFIAAGVLNWWPVLSPVRALARLSYPLQLLYLTLNCQPGVALGAILVFSRDVLYRSYEEAPRLFGISAYVDQQIGGLIMWVPGNVIYMVALSIVFFKWLQGEERDAQS
ncbi:MAG: cytochrome c oxidase assembly protein [Chloroflexi bacterium]|nr:cytochrome c oxidase assembly protein [Chloroflexota bacterium]